MKPNQRQIVFFGAIAALLLYSFPYFEAIQSANELPRIYLTRAMVEDGTFAIDAGVERWGGTADMSPSGGHYYSNKAPGSSFAAVPGYLLLKGVKAVVGAEPTLAEMMWVSRVTTGVLPTLLFLVLLFGFLRRYAPSEEVRRLVVVAYALGTMAMTYSVLFISHQLSAVCIAAAYMLTVQVIEDERDGRWMFVAGLAAGAAPLMDYQAAFAGVPIAVYVLWRLARRGRGGVRLIAYAAVGAALPIALLLYYHDAAFGSPLATGYHASKTFAHHHQRGFLGLDRFRIEALLGSTVASDNGLLLFSPFLLAAVPGWVLMFREPRRRWAAAVTLAIAAIYLLFISSISMWRGGWQMGPRYITVMLPFVLIPVAVAAARADRDWRLRALFVASVVVAVFVYGLSCAEFPHFPEKFKNPLYEVTLRLIGDGHAPYNAGWLIGLRGFASLLPYLLALAALLVWATAPARRHVRGALVGWVLAAGIIACYAGFPGGGARAESAYHWVTTVMPQ